MWQIMTSWPCDELTGSNVITTKPNCHTSYNAVIQSMFNSWPVWKHFIAGQREQDDNVFLHAKCIMQRQPDEQPCLGPDQLATLCSVVPVWEPKISACGFLLADIGASRCWGRRANSWVRHIQRNTSSPRMLLSLINCRRCDTWITGGTSQRLLLINARTWLNSEKSRLRRQNWAASKRSMTPHWNDVWKVFGRRWCWFWPMDCFSLQAS